MLIRHFYHVWAGGDWHEPVSEHAEALRVGGFPVAPVVGIVGPASARTEVRSYCQSEMGCTKFVEAARGYEHVTLRAVHSYAMTSPRSVVLYAHSKGAHHPNPLNTVLRRSSTRRLVVEWEGCLKLLTGNDAVGCHWLSPSQYPVRSPYFAGNFWWATAHHLAQLPAIDEHTRFTAEGWIGTRLPKVTDLRPGWPTWGLFGREVAQLLNPRSVIA